MLLLACLCLAAVPLTPSVDLRDSLRPSAVRDLAAGSVLLTGRAPGALRMRVTTSLGQVCEANATARDGRFALRYPQDFPGAPPLAPALLYVDATDAPAFGQDLLGHQSEIVLIVGGASPEQRPDLPQVFTDDFTDAAGRLDRECAQWARQRALTNLFKRSRGAALMLIGQSDFDLDRPADYAWFREHATLYDFDHRDRDWSQPLGHRVARGFWQAVWNSWFNASNDHPWDGNPANRAQSNFRPYTFANDPADLAVVYALRRGLPRAVADNRDALVDDVLRNLLALQHRGADNFALREASGRQEHYTAGAFHYGMFETGEWLTEGLGWFHNSAFRDFAWGGVLNGRCVWALGEALAADPRGPLASQCREALALATRFCLHDGLARGYTHRSRSGKPVWGIAGEHSYLLYGLLAACRVAPDLPIRLAGERPLREVTRDALDALAETTLADGTWSHYANVDATNLGALATGAQLWPDDPHAALWRQTAARAADVWLALSPLPAERGTPTPVFGHRQGNGLTFYLGADRTPHIALYVSGLWLHALAVLAQVTHEPRHAARAEAILSYYCGDNPLCARLLNELGSVCNRLTDTDKDGLEDELRWNAYPESTAFVQIGLLHLLAGRGAQPSSTPR